MNISNPLLLAFIAFFVISSKNITRACSMYKVTAGGKTMVGCNEDAWRTTPRIWFNTAKNNNEYGTAYTGSRQVSSNRFAPQSGMNEAGLVFSRLASYHPKKSHVQNDKKKITNEVSFLSDILQKCATIKEVAKFYSRYDHSFFIDDVLIYVDSTGKYLVVEPYNLIEGDEAYYVLSNFCPSITDQSIARKLERYRNGEDYLTMHKMEATLSYCTALSDTMHVCRNRNGDGTLLTSIWDTKNGLVNLFFYHSYDHSLQFNLADELAKGDHIIDVASIFPVNSEFERLSQYITPFNTPSLRVLLVALGGFLVIISFIYGLAFILKSKKGDSYIMMMVLLGLNLLLTFYFYVLATNMNIYYMDAPYQHYDSNLISISSYTPVLMLLSIIPILVYILRYAKNESKNRWISGMLIGNSLVYLISIIGFGYWGLYNVLH